MGRPEEYEICASWRINGDDKDVELEIEWAEEQMALHNVAERSLVTAQRLVWSADPVLSNSEAWCNE